MKTKFVRNARTDRRELVIATQRGEELDERRAKVLAKDVSSLLLPFSYEAQRAGALLRYDVEGRWSLRTFLAKRQLGMDELLGLMRAAQGVLDLCAERHLRQECLFFDPELVFVNSQGCPSFVLVPVEELPFQERNSPLALLKAMGGTEALRFSSPDAEVLSRRVGAFVVEQGGVFSANAYRRFLESEEDAAAGDQDAPEARRSVVEGGEASTWATAGGATVRPAATDGALFWNPLQGLAAEEPEQPAVPVPDAAPAPAPAMPAPASVSPEPAPKPSHQAFLVRSNTGKTFPLTQGVAVRLGRGSASEVRLLGNPKLSRTHAAVTWAGDKVLVTDLGAANGVWVQGQRLAAQQTMATGVDQPFMLADEQFYVRIG